VKTPLCLEARSVIPSSIHPRELNLDWLNMINLKEDDEATSGRNSEDDEANDGNDAPKTSQTLDCTP